MIPLSLIFCTDSLTVFFFSIIDYNSSRGGVSNDYNRVRKISRKTVTDNSTFFTRIQDWVVKIKILREKVFMNRSTNSHIQEHRNEYYRFLNYITFIGG